MSDPASAPSVSDFDAAVAATERALVAFTKGDPEPMKELFSTRDDVVLANPLGPPARGRTAVETATERAASFVREGDCEFEELARHSSEGLGYLFHIERAQFKIADSDELRRASLRVTMIYRREDEGWKIVHRQADPIMTPRPIESILETS